MDTYKVDPTDFITSTLLMADKFSIDNPKKRIAIRFKQSDRIKTLGKIQNIYEFIRSLWQAFQLHRPSMVFEPAYPVYVLDKEDAIIQRQDKDIAPEIPEEIISWTLVRRAPGSLDGNPFARMKEILPRIREELFYDMSL
jgi:hypothetical protein